VPGVAVNETALARIADLSMTGMKFGVYDNLFHNDSC
jgi:hypothetical protein